MDTVLRLLALVFGPRYYVVEYESEDVAHYGTVNGNLTAIGGVGAFGGCYDTGVFRSRKWAEKYRTYIAARYADEWPLIPTKLVRLHKGDTRLARYFKTEDSQWD